MPGNDNILAKIGLVPLSANLSEPPPVDNQELASWFAEIRHVMEENAEETFRSLNALRTMVTEQITTITSSSYTTTDDDFLILADAVGGAITIILPPAADVLHQVFVIKRLNSGANSVTIDGNGANIDGSPTFVISVQYNSIMVFCDGTNYHII